jgi:hypothetical protein
LPIAALSATAALSAGEGTAGAWSALAASWSTSANPAIQAAKARHRADHRAPLPLAVAERIPISQAFPIASDQPRVGAILPLFGLQSKPRGEGSVQKSLPREFAQGIFGRT